MLYDPSCGHAVQQPKRLAHFLFAIDQQMNVVVHYDVCEDQDTVFVANFLERIAKDLFQFIGTEDRKPMMRDRRLELFGIYET